MNSQRVDKLSDNDDHLQNKKATFFSFQCFLTFSPQGNKWAHYSTSFPGICRACVEMFGCLRLQALLKALVLCGDTQLARGDI